ncbi:MAG: ABC-three component system protein [Anaerovoracaceae bacterium]
MVNNIFIHDAIPTWSGFLYQGQIAVYLAVKKIYELDLLGEKEEADYYAIEMEKCEDIAIVYKNKGAKQYKSIHQAKNYAKQRLGDYKSPLTQLMLEKGFCQKNGYGVPDAYLHVSRQVLINDGETFKDKMEEWKSEITRFYEILCDLYRKLNKEDTNKLLEKLANCINDQPISFNRAEYKNILAEIKKACGEEDVYQAKEGLKELLSFLEQNFYVPEINENVKIYSYDDGNNYCTGIQVFENIVNYVVKYKGSRVNFSQKQYEYIADKMLCFIEKKILTRHQFMQEGREASCSIPLYEFVRILDEGIERYEEEANILTLIRKYDERIDAYCSVCKKTEKCLGESCRLQQPDSRRNMLEKDQFVKLCYNLNPECADEITDRACLSELLNEDGMLESVLASIDVIPENCFVKKEDKSRFEVMNHGKVAFLTAISSGYGNLTVKKIEKALSVNQDLIENIFEADQLVTTRLEESPSIWDNSCVKIRKGDLLPYGNMEEDEEHSIYVAKKPEFIKSEYLIREIGTESR